MIENVVDYSIIICIFAVSFDNPSRAGKRIFKTLSFVSEALPEHLRGFDIKNGWIYKTS